MNEKDHVIDVAQLFDKLEKDEPTLGGIHYIYNDERRTSQNIIEILLTLVQQKFRGKNIIVNLEQEFKVF